MEINDEDTEQGQAIQLIQISDDSEQFEITSEGMSFLASLPRDKFIKVVAIAGPYRTGKSFLLNRYIGQMRGFQIGSSVQSCTKGIWIWNKPIYENSENDEEITILLDTEGLNSSERSTDIDLKIFALTILLSSTFIYNQIGAINEQTLTDLHLIVNLVKYFGNLKTDLQASSARKNDSIEQMEFQGPDFYWCLRDFYLDISKEFESSDDYMEDCLKPVLESVSADTLKKNQIRKQISKFFKVRHCHTLIRPVDDEETLANIELLDWDSQYIKSKFRQQCDEFMMKLRESCKIKTINSKRFNGQMLLGLSMDFCEAVNNNETPKIENSVTRLVCEEIQLIQDEAYAQLQSFLENEIQQYPINEDQFNEIYQQALSDSVKILQINLSRLLQYGEILLETEKFKQRIEQTKLIQTQQNLNYVQGFFYSWQLLEHFLDQDKDKLFQINSDILNLHESHLQQDLQNQTDQLKEYYCQDPEAVAQNQNINTLFSTWQKVIKMYRAGGSKNDQDGDDLDDQSIQLSEDNDQLISPAHYDLLAEVITKLMPQKPSWIGDDNKISRKQLQMSGYFIDYEKIDLIEREEQDTEQIVLKSQDEYSLKQDNDTLEGQGRVKSKDNYLPKIQEINILEKIEQIFEQNLQRDVYDTMYNLYNIQLANAKKNEQKLKYQKQENDNLLRNEEKMSLECIGFKEEFDSKIQNIQREINMKKKEVEQAQKISELESQKLKKQFQEQIKEKDKEINDLQNKYNQIQENLNQITDQYLKAEQAKNLEVSQHQNQIQKLEEDFQQVNDQLEFQKNQEYLSEEAQQQLQFLLNFQKESQETLQNVKDQIDKKNIDSAKNFKMKNYELQNKINEIEYKSTQDDKNTKRILEEQLNQKKQELQSIFEREYQKVEEQRQVQYSCEDEQNELGRQLENLLQSIFNEQNEKENSSDSKMQILEQVNQSLKLIEQEKKTVKKISQEQNNLSDKILQLSMGNGIRQNDKETITVMLLQVVKKMNGIDKNGLENTLLQIENMELKQNVQEMLQQYKLIK